MLASEHRRREPCGRRDMPRDGPEHRADEAVGRPAHERDRPAGPRHADELRGRAPMVGRAHGAEDRQCGVERFVGDRDRLGVAVAKSQRSSTRTPDT